MKATKFIILSFLLVCFALSLPEGTVGSGHEECTTYPCGCCCTFDDGPCCHGSGTTASTLIAEDVEQIEDEEVEEEEETKTLLRSPLRKILRFGGRILQKGNTCQGACWDIYSHNEQFVKSHWNVECTKPVKDAIFNYQWFLDGECISPENMDKLNTGQRKKVLIRAKEFCEKKTTMVCE